MKKLLLLITICCCCFAAMAQPPKTEVYDLIKKLLTDSTGFENVGDWSVGNPKKFPVLWKNDRVEMSEDTSINFFRTGVANLAIKGKSFTQESKLIKWNLLLKGPHAGYTSFSIISSPMSSNMPPKYNIDSVFGKKPFTAKLLKSCETKNIAGYFYYEVKLPKKDVTYLKISWISVNGSTAMRIDCFDSFSKYAVKLDCPK